MKNKTVRISAALIIVFFLPSFLFVFGCSDGNDTRPLTDLADLTIAGIDVIPQVEWHPKFVAEEFGLNVTVRNIGTKSSGRYNISLYIEELSNGFLYPIGTFIRDLMPSGEIYTVYSSIDRLIYNLGIHRVNVEIIPIGWEDADLSNNTKYHDFNVVLY